ncbi:MAG: DUF6883 domain-containing protein [Nitrospirota bacterium]
MKLENKEYAYIPLAKLLDYLLSETHPVGKSKAKYLRSLGFNEVNINLLKEGLLSIARSEDVNDVISSSHGVKYVIDGTLQTPMGVIIKLRTIWAIDKDMDRPRFITAYPIETKGG